jgi:hypothetical protein
VKNVIDPKAIRFKCVSQIEFRRGFVMSETSYNKLLIEEYKNALEHCRFLEAKRDRFVVGDISASVAVFVLIAQIFSKEGFLLRTASIEFIMALGILCLSISFLSWFLRTAYISLAPILIHYETVMSLVREKIYDKEFYENENINKSLVDWMDTRKNPNITNRKQTVSSLSKWILFWFSLLWLFAGIDFFLFLFFRCCY